MQGVGLQELERRLRPHGVLPLGPLRQRPLSLVFPARQAGTGRPLFVKLLTSSSAGVRRNFHREIDILRALSGNAGIKRMVASSASPTLAFHACERLAGSSLVDLVAMPEGRELAVLLRHGAALAGWIAALHRLEFVHRDLSPDHVFIDADGSLAVVDFGMARRTPDLPLAERRLCEGYDVQSLGMILWEMICGSEIFPYRGPGLPDVLRREIELVRGARLPANVRRLLVGCLSAASEFTPNGLPPRRGFGNAVEALKAFGR